jgi:hypothetical protein
LVLRELKNIVQAVERIWVMFLMTGQKKPQESAIVLME